MNYNTELQNNNDELQEILNAVNELPEAGGGTGEAGVGISSIKQTTKSTEDDGVNVITVTLAELGSQLSLGIASDGLIYLFVNGSPVGTGIPQSTGVEGDVFGYVDENNTIVLNGDLADGTYIIKYEMENGTVVDIGDMVLDTNVYYSITNALTNCTTSNNITKVAEGESYSATITANSGYELSSIKVTMGGANVSVSGGKINIASVTGDIVITAVATEKAKEPTNFEEYNSANTTDWSIWINNARAGSDGTYRSDTVSAEYGTPVVTNYVAVQNGDIVEFGGYYVSGKNSVVYGTNKAILGNGQLNALTAYLSDFTDKGSYTYSFKINNEKVAYIRIGGYIHTAYGNHYIKIKRNGEYL